MKALADEATAIFAREKLAMLSEELNEVKGRVSDLEAMPEGKRIVFHGAGFGFDKKNKKDDLRVPFDDEGVGGPRVCFSIKHLKTGNVKVQAKENDLHYDGKPQSIDKDNRVIKQGNQGSYLIGESDYLNFRIGDYVVQL
jgi:hypothetical protein